MNILVTGGAGFIGSHTVDALVERGHAVRMLDNLSASVHPKGKPDYLNPAAEFILGDVRSKQTWQQALDGIDAVYHFAAYQDYLPDFSTFFDVNTVSTALLYEVIVEKGMASKVTKVITAASQAVMGEGRYKCPECHEKNQSFHLPDIRLEAQLSRGEWEHLCPACGQVLQWVPSDESVTNPCNQYAISKYAQERLAIQLGKRYGIPSTVMRYAIVQGPRQSFYNAYSGAMRVFALSLLLDRRPIIFEDGQQVRDYVNIGDVVEANLMVLGKAAADYTVFNVGGGTAWTVIDFYNSMQHVVGKEIDPIMTGHYRYGDTRHIFSDTTRLRSLGWQPTRSISESIGAYWEYINTAQDMGEILQYAEENMKQLKVIRRSRKTA